MAKTRAQMRQFLADMDYAEITQDFHEPGAPSLTGSKARIEDIVNGTAGPLPSNICNTLAVMEGSSPGFRYSFGIEFLVGGVFLGASILDLEDGTEILPYRYTLVNKRQPGAGPAIQNQLLMAGNALYGRIKTKMFENELRISDLPPDEMEIERAKVLARGFTNEPTENYRRRVGDLRGRRR